MNYADHGAVEYGTIHIHIPVFSGVSLLVSGEGIREI
jgi:hypothetical protein